MAKKNGSEQKTVDQTKTVDKSAKSEKKAEKTSSQTKPTKDKSNSFKAKVARYFKDLKSEFKKVVWPTKKEVFDNTLVVLVTMVILGLFVGGLDTGMFKLLELFLNKAA